MTDKERYETLTRANVIQLGLLVLLLGVLGYWGLRFVGFEDASAGIASEAILVLIICGWTASYLIRVVTGKMTFMEQRKRYRQSYEKLTNSQLQSQFDSLSEDEQIRLIDELETENNSLNSSCE